MSKQRLIGMLVLKHFTAARSKVHRCYSVKKLRQIQVLCLLQYCFDSFHTCFHFPIALEVWCIHDMLVSSVFRSKLTILISSQDDRYSISNDYEFRFFITTLEVVDFSKVTSTYQKKLSTTITQIQPFSSNRLEAKVPYISSPFS